MKHRPDKRPRWWRRHWVLSLLSVVLVLCLGALGGLAYSVASAPLAPPRLSSLLATSVTAPNAGGSIRWPSVGEGSFAVPSLGVSGDTPTQTPVPIGSITKMMVAFVVLADYPLVAGASGPSVTVYQEDVDAYNLELLDGQSVVAIAPGEMLDEYQLLEGLLVHSSNDYAALLASLDAGSIDALVAKMNAEAQKLGLTMTHYTDVSGVDPGSVSTPHDQLILAEKLLANPVASSIVAMTSVDLPVSGLVTSYQPLLGSKGVVGVKSGLTSEAGGCDVMAVDESIAGHPVEILAAVTGQQGTDRLASAGDAAMAIVSSVDSTIQRVPISGNRVPIANLGWPKSYAPVNLAKSLIIPAWPGQKVTVEVLAARRFRDWLRRGQIAAYVVVHSATFSAKVPAKIVQDLHEPTLLQRVV